MRDMTLETLRQNCGNHMRNKEEKYIITVWGYGYKFVRYIDE